MATVADQVTGILRDVPMEDYHRMPGASSSQLKELDRSPAHLKAYLDGLRSKSSAALDFGSALHCALLEPELFAASYVVAEQCSAVTGKGAQCSREGSVRCGGKWFCTQHQGEQEADAVTVISRKDQENVLGAMRSINAHPAASAVLARVTHRELSGLWLDEESGQLCRARFDAVAPSLGATVELKTAADASVTGFTKAIYKFRYYRQGAHYLNGADAVLVDDPEIAAVLHPDGFHRHIVIAVESGGAPWAVNVFALRDDALHAGREELRPLLRLYRHCTEMDDWPQESREYSTEPQDISLPVFAWREIDERTEREGV